MLIAENIKSKTGGMKRLVEVPLCDNKTDLITVYDLESFPYERFTNCSIIERGKKKCYNLIATFDIETTSFLEEECDVLGCNFGFMYVWQFCIGSVDDSIPPVICMGRTWADYYDFIAKLKEAIWVTSLCHLIVWVHSLPFEFQFMRDFFEVERVFAKDKRNVVQAVMEDVEYRCSLSLTNMGLAKATQKTKGVVHKKLDGAEFDYSIKRYPDTELSNLEYSYCICDVLGLYEVIKEYLKDDTLLTLPMTSTGYVRRDYREVMKTNKKNEIDLKDKALTPYTYALCIETSRGAIAGSNHVWTNQVLWDVDSFDIKSSYPFQMMTKYFPHGKFYKAKIEYGESLFYDYLEQNCCIITWSCSNLRLKKYSGIPYISKAKCRAIQGADCGNGKVYSAERIGMTCTEIDFKIICEQYEFDCPIIYEMWICERAPLSREFRGHLAYMFQEKTDLEDGDKFLYAKFKNKINASFGMMLTDILHPEVIFTPHSIDPWRVEEIEDIDKALRNYYNAKSSFLSYQDGIWVLAHGRHDLVKGMNIAGHDLVQVDTDSVKTLHNHRAEFEALNSSIIEKAESYSIKPYSIKNGKKHYLGIWEHEGKDGEYTYHKFKTLGAKKYAEETKDGHIYITVAGLSKKAGAYIETKGGLDFIQNGAKIPSAHSGRTTSYYVDMEYPKIINVNGHTVRLGSNICVKNVEYTFGMTDEWLDMVLDGECGMHETFEFNGAYGCY